MRKSAGHAKCRNYNLSLSHLSNVQVNSPMKTLVFWQVNYFAMPVGKKLEKKKPQDLDIAEALKAYNEREHMPGETLTKCNESG